MRGTFLACLGLAVASLALPSEPSFDPAAWIVWGREVWHFDLDTTAGPAWKPLTVAFTTLFAPFELVDDDLPAALWLVVARTGALLSLVLAFRLARRLAGAGRWTGIGAGAVAAFALVLTPQWLRYAAHGNEAPMAVALMLYGVERHLDGRRDWALGAGFLACLLRPEAFPFVAAYGVWTWRADPALRRLIAALAAALPALWLIPEWLSSGNPLGAGRKASSEPSWSLSLLDHPWLEVLERAHEVAGLPLELGALAAVGFAVARRDRRVLALAGVAVAWLALVAVMTQAGFSGNSRYFAPAIVAACLLTGLAAAWTVAAAARRGGTAGGALAALALALVAGPWTDVRVSDLGRQADDTARLVELHDQLVRAVEAAGGADTVVAYGEPSVNHGFIPQLAWETGLPLSEVEHSMRDGLVFTTAADSYSGEPPEDTRDLGPRRQLERVGVWRVLGPARIVADPSAAGCREDATAPAALPDGEPGERGAGGREQGRPCPRTVGG